MTHQRRPLRFFFNPRLYAAMIGIAIGLMILSLLLPVTPGGAGVIGSPVAGDGELTPDTFAPPQDIREVDGFNVLLLGYGGAGHDGGYLTDAIMLVRVDIARRRIGLISIPRDLWVTFPSGKKGKINAAFVNEDSPQYPTETISLGEALKGAVKAKSAIAEVTGLTPHFFVGIDFASFVSLIDALGGVTVDVPEAFDDPWYPVKGRELELCGHTPEEVTELSARYSGFELEKQFSCRYERVAFERGKIQMDGTTALKFVRSRHSPSGGNDFSRSKRQQALLLGIRDRLLSGNGLKDPVALFRSLTSFVRTNFNENLVRTIVPLVGGIGQYAVVHVSLTTDNVLMQSTSPQRAFILVPRTQDWADVQRYIAEQLGE